MKKILFVCLGNICRSAMAQGILEAELSSRGITGAFVDSAGTGDWHTGNQPDSRAISTVQTRGIDISGQRARQLKLADFKNFDMIIAMDRDNYTDIMALAARVSNPKAAREKVSMCLDYATNNKSSDVPDPYYGAQGGFGEVLALLEDSCSGLADHITSANSTSAQ